MGEELVPQENIENKIYFIRGQKVMLDIDLAGLYEVPTKRLNEQVKRNIERFPDDFMFRLTFKEWENLKSQFATSSYGGRRYLPYAFTEHGILMLSSVLNSQRAISVNIQIMRAFVKLRRFFASHEELKRKIAEMEKKYDGQFKVVFEAIYKLMEMEPKKIKQIGFKK